MVLRFVTVILSAGVTADGDGTSFLDAQTPA